MSEVAKAQALRLVAYTDADGFGGAEQVLGTILERISDDIEVVVMGVDDDIVSRVAARRPGASTVVVPPVRTKRDIRAIARHVQAMRRIAPDVCHVNLRTPYACQYGLLAAFLSRGTRVVAVEHLPLSSQSALRRALKRRSSSRLAAHVAVGEWAARLVEVDAGLPGGSIQIIHNGVPAPPVGAPVVRLVDGTVVGAVGRLDPQKGFDTLIEALARIEGVTVVIVGDGPERASLESRARELGVHDRLVITGWRDDARSLLAGFDVFALPSRYEGFPLVVLEAMQAGVPVVATDVGSVSEAVADGETGLLVTPGDAAELVRALTRLLGDEPLRLRLAESGRALALDHFEANTMAKEYERIYRALAQ